MRPSILPSQLGRSTTSKLLELSAFNAAWGQITSALSALIGIRIYTHLLTTSEFGYAMLAMGGVALLDGLFLMAFNQTLLALCGQAPNPERQRCIAAGLSIRIITLLLAVSSLPLLLLTLSPVLNDWMALSQLALPLALTYLSSESLKIGMLAPMVVNKRYFHLSLWTSVEAIIVLAITTFGLLAISATARTYIVSFVTARALSTALLFVIGFNCRYFKTIDFTQAKAIETQAFQYGWPVSLMAPLGWAATYLDRYLLTAVSGASVTGAYSAAMAVALRPYALLTSILTSYFRPALWTNQGKPITAALRWKIQGRWVTAACTLGCFGTMTFAGAGPFLATLLLGDTFQTDIVYLLVIVSIGQTFAIMTHALDNTILSTGASRALLRAQVILAVSGLLLLILFTVWKGPRGAVLGRSLAEVLKFLYTLAVSYRQLHPQPSTGNVGCCPSN